MADLVVYLLFMVFFDQGVSRLLNAVMQEFIGYFCYVLHFLHEFVGIVLGDNQSLLHGFP